MSEQGRCKTCKWWFLDAPREHNAKDYLSYGACRLSISYTPVITDWPGDGEDFTHPDFGCIHHEAKEDGNA